MKLVEIGIVPAGVKNFYNCEGKNMRTVWSLTNEANMMEKHYASYPKKLVARMLRSGCPEGGIVLDPFMGSGTTAIVARQLSMNYIGFELNPEYIKICNNRLNNETGLF
jgi:site-specific DNA-methyltransferase (adenine-specific)